MAHMLDILMKKDCNEQQYYIVLYILPLQCTLKKIKIGTTTDKISYWEFIQILGSHNI